MKRSALRLIAALALLVSFLPAQAFAARARLCESIWAGLHDNSDAALASGTVTFYEPGTTTPKTIYATQTKSSTATNPFTLDAQGRGTVYGDGSYKIVVKNSGGTTLYTIDPYPCEALDGRTINAGTSGGSSSAYTLTPSPTAGAYDDGDIYFFRANHTNTGASTINVSSLGAKALRKLDGSTALAAGDVVNNQFYITTYKSSLDVFVLLNPKVQDYTNLGTTTGSANAYVATPTIPLSAYVDGQVYTAKLSFANTAAATLNVSSLGTKTIKKEIYGIKYDVIEGDLVSGLHALLKYDGTDLVILNPKLPNTVLFTTAAGTETASSTSVVNTAAATIIANTMQAGVKFRIEHVVEVLNTSGGSVNYVVRALWGATNNLSTPNIAVANNTNRGTLHIKVVGTASASVVTMSGTVIYTGDGSDSSAGQMRTVSATSAGSGTSSQSFSSNQTLGISLQMGTSSANATFRPRQTLIIFD